MNKLKQILLERRDVSGKSQLDKTLRKWKEGSAQFKTQSKKGKSNAS